MSCKVIYFFTFVFMSISRLNCWLPVQDDYCLVQDDQQYPFYNKYTPYNSVHSTEKLGELPDGCVAIHFAMISRSGNHFPSSKTIQQINNVVKIIKNILQRNEKSIQFCQEDLNLLITYLNVLDENLALELTSQGSYDMIEMAKRKKQEFPSIMDRPYSADVFEFVVDDSIDLVESAQAFALGLFNSTDIVIEKTDPELLQHIKKTCFDFQSNKEANQYYNNFLSSDIVAKSVSNINRRLGFRKNEGLTKEQIITLYKACGFDSSQDLSKKSLFCVPFTPHDLQVFDYLEDLSRYYTRFVLNEEIREEIASPMIQNIFTTFDEIVSQDGILPGKPLANFYFPYQGVIRPFMAAIGLIDINNAIGSENYDDDCDNRKFKSSHFDPYSSNIDLILFKCKNGERYRVMIRSQEKPITHLIEGCEADNGLYCWRSFKNYTQQLFKKINVEPITPTPEYTTVNVDEISPPRKKYVLRY